VQNGFGSAPNRSGDKDAGCIAKKGNRGFAASQHEGIGVLEIPVRNDRQGSHEAVRDGDREDSREGGREGSRKGSRGGDGGRATDGEARCAARRGGSREA